ncbi:hypothetical protein L917_10704 [Phytophthora nicotianae]|uniref:Uncharacterized protein n=2 Tax=Phytophthora nicotianae TaxID=4792 RepID=W2Q578_PHYN3|nr:hypothetical protein PPTG_23180 [Phytophthora nicotianae INRA-310]ETL90653.1 hypothetical protein L917_10704 [Phytophthora nicotianae]ETN07425.1 hypothetical protein PPTG_23180 [Phytophthora nicotianae INRA-310]
MTREQRSRYTKGLCHTTTVVATITCRRGEVSDNGRHDGIGIYTDLQRRCCCLPVQRKPQLRAVNFFCAEIDRAVRRLYLCILVAYKCSPRQGKSFKLPVIRECRPTVETHAQRPSLQRQYLVQGGRVEGMMTYPRYDIIFP